MNSQFHVDRGSCSTAQQGYDDLPAFEPNRPSQTWQFVNDFQGLMGDDSEPDPLFFVETWTLGSAAAVENFKQRRQRQADYERQSDASSTLDRLGALSFVQTAVYAEFLSPAPAPADSCDASASPNSPRQPFAQAQNPAPQDAGPFAEECAIYPMTQESACRLLGVTATSTQKQIKAAYRRLVSQFHPDHLEFQANDVRQRATERMAAINDAYHLLRKELLP
jgi:DnaJ-domain-containing protein 1